MLPHDILLKLLGQENRTIDRKNKMISEMQAKLNEKNEQLMLKNADNEIICDFENLLTANEKCLSKEQDQLIENRQIICSSNDDIF